MTFDDIGIEVLVQDDSNTGRDDPRFKKLLAVAWAAGFIDGEGCIHLSKHQLVDRDRPTYRLTLSVSQNHRGCLVKLASALGIPAKIYSVKRSVSHNRDVFVLPICDRNAFDALRLLLPHLERKRPEAEVAIAAYIDGQLQVHPGARGHAPSVWKTRERYYQKLRRMK